MKYSRFDSRTERGGGGGVGACSAPEEEAAEGEGLEFDHPAIQKDDLQSDNEDGLRGW